MPRALIGAVLTLIVAIAARRTHTLSSSGALTAMIVGTLAVAAGWSWGLLLLAFFISASVLSRVGEPGKKQRVLPIVEKGSERDVWQVLANGGAFAAAALGQLVWPGPQWFALAAGALAASAADTWATEVGTLASGQPISITRGRKVPPGTSGAVSVAGSMAAVAGAAFIAAMAALAAWPVGFAAILLGGITGALVDSILGDTLQSRRWCDVCAMATERRVHDCGTSTRSAGGIAGFDNDWTNVVCSVAGALIALLLA
jgi:uncharacterized protein (TIGR00297 family)